MTPAASPFKNQTIFVLGLGKSGRSVAQSLLKGGAHVLVWDDHKETREAARKEGIPLANLDTIEWQKVDHFILSPGIPHRYPVPHPLVKKAQNVGLQPINDLEILYKTQPHAFYVGITGTNGKSTTTALIGHILREAGKRVGVGGNLGIPAMDLQPLNEDGIYVLEASSYQLETAPSLHFNVSILLNITPDHLERHGGMNGYIQAKTLIYQNATLKDTLVISVDDPFCSQIYNDLHPRKKVRLVPISTQQILTKGVSVSAGRLYEDGQFRIDLAPFPRLKGQHNWQNMAAAYGALRSMGLETNDIERGISTFPGLAHRQQVVAQYQNVLFINDSKATNAEAVEKVLLCYPDHPIYWLLGGQSKAGGIESLKPYFSMIKHAYLFGEAKSLFSSTLEGAVPYTLCETLEEAVGKASALALRNQESGAIVLLSPACASFDQFKNFEERGEVFCSAVHALIKEKP